MSNPNYSENWNHLKTLLNGFDNDYRKDEDFSLQDHNYAKALSIFLTNASLATPKLNRDTIQNILSGAIKWPNESGNSNYQNKDLKLSFLEENGLVSFYADWLTVHCNSVKDRTRLDPSMNILLDAIEHLKNIKYGWNGFIRPYFKCEAQTLKSLIRNEFGHDDLTKLLPDLVIEGDCYKLPPDNKNFDSLASTYLWHTLTENNSNEMAFETWMLCMRVNCDWCIPVKFTDRESEKRDEFNQLLLTFLSKDIELENNISRIGRQVINQSEFSHLITPDRLQINLSLDPEKAKFNKSEEFIEVDEKVSLNSLSSTYPLREIDPTVNNFQFVKSWKQFRCRDLNEVFYSGLINHAIRSDMRIEWQYLSAHNFIEEIIELSKTRPLLRHLLFIGLTEFYNFDYKLLLLSRPDTCDVGLFFLVENSFERISRKSRSFAKQIDDSFQLLLTEEYLSAVNKEPDSIERILNVVEYIGEKCDFFNSNFSNKFEYRFLLCLLNQLTQSQVIELGKAFVKSHKHVETNPQKSSANFHLYLIGFWLIDRLEQLGIDHDHALQSTLLNYYINELALGIDCKKSFHPNEFLASLPWHKIISEDNYSILLEISSDLPSLKEKLLYKANENPHDSANALRSYLLILIVIGRFHKSEIVLAHLKMRVLELVIALGFGKDKDVLHIFDEAFFSNKYDLWTEFCSFTNLLGNSQFDEFIKNCLDHIPPNQRFVLMERCTIISRTDTLRNSIATLKINDYDEMGISKIEDAFSSAWRSDQNQVAIDLLVAGDKFLNDARFDETTNVYILGYKNRWLRYQYYWRLIALQNKYKDNPDGFRKSAHEVPIPDCIELSSKLDSDHVSECNSFRSYIIAAAYLEINPEKSISILERLCEEFENSDYKFMLLRARINHFKTTSDIASMKRSLAQFLVEIKIVPNKMVNSWVSTLLDIFRQIKDKTGLDDLWAQLSFDQKNTKDILYSYCNALIEWGDKLIAQQVINRFEALNPGAKIDLDVEDLKTDISVAEFNESASKYLTATKEDSLPTNAQLSLFFSHILAKPFPEYVSIVQPGKQSHEYLKGHVQAILRELLIRKTNLQIHSKSTKKKSRKLTEEDLLNDWFTSLFDNRMSQARLGFRDQKRAGSSSSGIRPGQPDGFITCAENDRHAIFEAFRLFSLDTSVIDEHLNKISQYDQECLNTVFIVAYCEVKDFGGLVTKYKDYISKSSYKGFSIKLPREDIKTEYNSNLWIGKEIRKRGEQEVFFYHFLLNFAKD